MICEPQFGVCEPQFGVCEPQFEKAMERRTAVNAIQAGTERNGLLRSTLFRLRDGASLEACPYGAERDQGEAQALPCPSMLPRLAF